MASRIRCTLGFSRKSDIHKTELTYGEITHMKNVLYMHGGSGNRGCEAIVRTTSEILNDPGNTVLWTLARHEDLACGLDEKFGRIVGSEELRRFSPAYFEALWNRKVLHRDDANMKVFLRQQFKGNIAVSVGGDNYCYPWSARQNAELNREIRKHCRASVLWSCSIDPEAVTPEIREDLAGYDLITVREPLTFELLKPINPHVIRVADPAFLLRREDLPLPENFLEGNTVGVNVSPLIMKYGTEGSLIINNYRNMIRSIIEETDMNVCLIPHVMWENNNDLEPIRLLYGEFKHTGRVCMIEDGTAMQLKGYIARCRFFVGARTHATIAAYSSCVPTLVVGYSVKSRGIAQDLFGTDENYVLPVQRMKSEKNLNDSLAWLIDNENSVRHRLREIIPEYAGMTRAAVELMHSF